MSGAGLIEVLIAVLVLAVGMLGIAAMYSVALRNSQSALERSQGIIGTYSILDAMRANLDDARAGSYAMSETCTIPTADSTILEKDIRFWLQGLHATLGEGACGEISCSGNACDITVKWDDTRGRDGVGDMSFTTRAVF